MPEHERDLEIQICKTEWKIFWKHVWKFDIFQDNEYGGILFSIQKIGNYSINSIINLIILNYTCQSIKSRFRIT